MDTTVLLLHSDVRCFVADILFADQVSPPDARTERELSWVVLLIALCEAAFIGLFGFYALADDSLGIARAMAFLLGLPFLMLTMPALILLRRGLARPALALALASLPATWLAWRYA